MLNTIVLGNERNLPSRTISISIVRKHPLYKDKWELRIGNGSGKGAYSATRWWQEVSSGSSP